jgi:DNA-binding CsgD family transcriptional regulator
MAFRRAVAADSPVGVLDTARGPLVVTLAADGVATEAEQASAEGAATPGAGWSELWVGLGRAAAAGAAGRPDRAMVAFVTADTVARRYPLFRAVGLRLLAEAALRDGWGDPIDWLRDAEATFVAGGQDRAAGACRALLQRAGIAVPRRRGGDRRLPDRLLRLGVTAREADILELVVERLPNKDIAARLYLSPRTVEKHVAALLAKFGVSDRTALIQQARTP